MTCGLPALSSTSHGAPSASATWLSVNRCSTCGEITPTRRYERLSTRTAARAGASAGCVARELTRAYRSPNGTPAGAPHSHYRPPKHRSSEGTQLGRTARSAADEDVVRWLGTRHCFCQVARRPGWSCGMCSSPTRSTAVAASGSAGPYGSTPYSQGSSVPRSVMVTRSARPWAA